MPSFVSLVPHSNLLAIPSVETTTKDQHVTVFKHQFALNPLQWITVALPDSLGSPDDSLWEYDRPSFLDRQPSILHQVASAGFGAVMLEVLPTQTLQSYKRVVTEAGLDVAPGYVQVGLPEDFGMTFDAGSARAFRWFDGIRRRAEESNYMGLDRVFLAADMSPGRPRVETAAGIGHHHDDARLDRVANFIGEAAEVLRAEGVTAALHNHVGSWIETAEEIEYVLDAVPADLLSIGPDLGHLAWAGVDVLSWVRAHAPRISDVHVKDVDLEVAASVRSKPTPYFEATGRTLLLEPGLGMLPLVETLAALPEGFTGSVIIEVDHPTMDPFASAQQSWAWVEANFSQGSDARPVGASTRNSERLRRMRTEGDGEATP